MPQLFEKTVIKSMELENRAVRSATWSAVGDDNGFVTDKAIDLYRELARGGVGLIVTGGQFVMPNGIGLPHMIGNYDDRQLDGLTRLVDAVHSEGGKIVPQLVHWGIRANPALFPQEGEIWGPSGIQDFFSGNVPHEVTLEEIAQLVDAYAAAASRSKKAGFDGVQIHGSHGYGINQFLARVSNRRTDQYGGDISNRYRFLGEVLEAVRGAVGQDYPVMIKLNAHDYVPDGLEPEEGLYVGKRLQEGGIDAIEVTAGSRASSDGMLPFRTKIKKPEDEGYLLDLAIPLKEALDVPIITVGGYKSLEVIEGVLSSGKADYVAMCRPLIREPHLINRWKSGDTKKATCISCNQCLGTGTFESAVHCAVERKLREKRDQKNG
jgi:2,4-dienoyl-CoA reductase-like NADH-dependent reductase (Old Yellow Enzyme family)